MTKEVSQASQDAATADTKAKAEKLLKMQDKIKAMGSAMAESQIAGLAKVQGYFREQCALIVKEYPDFSDFFVTGYYDYFVKVGRSDAKVRKSEAMALIAGLKLDFDKVNNAADTATAIKLSRDLRKEHDGGGQNGGNSGARGMTAKSATSKIAAALPAIALDPKSAAHFVEKATAAIVQLPNFEQGLMRQIMNTARTLEVSTKDAAFIKAAQSIYEIAASFMPQSKENPDAAAEAAAQQEQQQAGQQDANAPQIKAA